MSDELSIYSRERTLSRQNELETTVTHGKKNKLKHISKNTTQKKFASCNINKINGYLLFTNVYHC